MANRMKLEFIYLFVLFLWCSFVTVESEQFSISDFTRIGLRLPEKNVVIMKSLQEAKAKDGEKKCTGCNCVGYNCGCCETLDIPKLHINETGCVNISYLPAPEYGISVTLTVNNYTLFNRTVSARNPPAVCVGVPHLKQYASLCVQFSNLTLSQSQFSGCVAVIAKLKYVLVDKIDLGCFHIPFSSEDSLIQYFMKYAELMGKTKPYKLKNFQMNP